MAKPKRFSEQLRDAILNADVSRYQIAELTGISQATLSRFVNGKGGLSVDGIDCIAECLGLQLQPIGRPKAAGKAKKSRR